MPCRSAGDPTGAPDSQDDVIEIGLLVLDEFSPDVSRRGRTRIEKPYLTETGKTRSKIS
jgi:hypothetical protein